MAGKKKKKAPSSSPVAPTSPATPPCGVTSSPPADDVNPPLNPPSPLNPPTEVPAKEEESNGLNETMNSAITFNTTMLTEFSDELDEDSILHGESIIESILKSQNQSGVSASGISSGEATNGSSKSNERPVVDDDPTMTEDESIVKGDQVEGDSHPTLMEMELSTISAIQPTVDNGLDKSLIPSTGTDVLADDGVSISGVVNEESKEGIAVAETSAGGNTGTGKSYINQRIESDDDDREASNRSSQILSQIIRNGQANAAQTAFTSLPAVISYCEEDFELAAKVRNYFPLFNFRDETKDFAFSPSEYRFCLLTPTYARSPGTVEVASAAADAGRLIILQISKRAEDEEVSKENAEEMLPEEWESLCLHSEYTFPAFTTELLSKALEKAEKYIIETVSKENDEYAAVVQIDEYNIAEELGHGAQGVVYRAEHEMTKEVVAIKELRGMANKISAEAKTEIAIMKRLSHPNVARLIKVFQPSPDVSDSLFLVLEYVAGGSLMTDSQVWKGGVEPLPIDRAQNVFQQLVRGISYLHHMRVLHRDIKPSNVLGNREHGIVKVSDFGVSSFTKVQKSARVLGEDDIICVGSCGTPAFLPPEASGAGFDVVYHGRPADVWSLGVTFYVLLCGNLPFRGQDRRSTAKLICEQKLKIPSHVPAPARELLTKMLEKDPSKRATLVWVANHPWIDVGNWKAEVSEEEPATVSMQEVSQSLSRPQSLRKTMKKRSQSILKMSTSFMRSILPAAPAMMKSSDNLVRRSTSSVASKQNNVGSLSPPMTSANADNNKAQPAISVPLISDEFDFFEAVKEFFCSCGGDRK